MTVWWSNSDFKIPKTSPKKGIVPTSHIVIVSKQQLPNSLYDTPCWQFCITKPTLTDYSQYCEVCLSSSFILDKLWPPSFQQFSPFTPSAKFDLATWCWHTQSPNSPQKLTACTREHHGLIVAAFFPTEIIRNSYKVVYNVSRQDLDFQLQHQVPHLWVVCNGVNFMYISCI